MEPHFTDDNFVPTEGSYIFSSISLLYVLRTFMRKTSTTKSFCILLQQSDNELPFSEMQKNWGGHRLRFQNKARGKLPQF